MTEDEFPWERKEREYREAREEREEAEAVAGEDGNPSPAPDGYEEAPTDNAPNRGSEGEGEGNHGNIVEEFEIDEAYMCTECTTLRYGHYTRGCPACGNKDVAVVTFRDE